MWFCPVSCEVCRDVDCFEDGCRDTGDLVLQVCELCGDLHVAFAEPPVCMMCWVRVERGDASKD